MKIFLICPVRNASNDQIKKMQDYIVGLEKTGYEVFYPARDNPHELTDDIGYTICKTNHEALYNSDEVHIFFDKDSKGSLFDIGMTFAHGKNIVIANPNDLIHTKGKSFSNMILEWVRQCELD